MKIKQYKSCQDLDIVCHLKAGMKIHGIRFNKKLPDTPMKVIYRLDFDPVYFAYSGNWTLRCHSRMLNDDAKIGEHDNLTEYLYINDKSIHKYKFPASLVIELNKSKQLANFLPTPTTNQNNDSFNLSIEHLQSSPFRKDPEGKGKKVKLGRKGGSR